MAEQGFAPNNLKFADLGRERTPATLGSDATYVFDGFSASFASGLWQTPFYRRQFERLGFCLSDLQRSEILKNMPAVTRDDLAKSAFDFVSSPLSVQSIYSSGTTGPAIQIFRGSADEARRWKIIRDGLNLKSDSELPINVLFLCSLSEGPEGDFVNEGIEVTRRNILRSEAEVRELLKNEFDVLTGSPAGLAWLRENGLRPNVRGICTTALQLPQHLRDWFEVHWKIPVLHLYSTTETGPIGKQCRNQSSTYHIFADNFISQVEDKLQITKLYVSEFPLVNYELPDEGRLTAEICRCGFEGQTIQQFKGRKSLKVPASFLKGAAK